MKNELEITVLSLKHFNYQLNFQQHANKELYYTEVNLNNFFQHLKYMEIHLKSWVYKCTVIK